jgi:hypothetical protein
MYAYQLFIEMIGVKPIIMLDLLGEGLVVRLELGITVDAIS